MNRTGERDTPGRVGSRCEQNKEETHTGGAWGPAATAPGGSTALKPTSCGQHAFCCGSSASSGRPRSPAYAHGSWVHLYLPSHEKDKIKDTLCQKKNKHFLRHQRVLKATKNSDQRRRLRGRIPAPRLPLQ